MNSLKLSITICFFLLFSCKETTINNNYTAKPGSIKGMVSILNYTGNPSISKNGVKVWISGTNYSTTTDSLGLWSLRNVQSGYYDIYFFKSGCDTTIRYAVQFSGDGIASGGTSSLYMIPDGMIELDSVSCSKDTTSTNAYKMSFGYRLDKGIYATFYVDTTENVSKMNYILSISPTNLKTGSNVYNYISSQIIKGQQLYVTAYSGRANSSTDLRNGKTRIIGLGKQSNIITLTVK